MVRFQQQDNKILTLYHQPLTWLNELWLAKKTIKVLSWGGKEYILAVPKIALCNEEGCMDEVKINNIALIYWIWSFSIIKCASQSSGSQHRWTNKIFDNPYMTKPKKPGVKLKWPQQYTCIIKVLSIQLERLIFRNTQYWYHMDTLLGSMQQFFSFIINST